MAKESRINMHAFKKQLATMSILHIKTKVVLMLLLKSGIRKLQRFQYLTLVFLKIPNVTIQLVFQN